jgi:hypothetical protein
VEDAIEIYKKILTIKPDHLHTIENISVLRLKNENHEEMVKYSEMGIKMGSTKCINNLALYYQTKQQYDKSVMLYKMGAEKNCPISMANLGYYYHIIDKNETEMKKYYKMAIKLNSKTALINLIRFYITINNLEKTKKYCLLATERNIIEYNYHLADIYIHEKNYKPVHKLIMDYLKNTQKTQIHQQKLNRINNYYSNYENDLTNVVEYYREIKDVLNAQQTALIRKKVDNYLAICMLKLYEPANKKTKLN